jgi:beta-glucosidase
LSYANFTYGDASVYVSNASALEFKYPTGPMGLGGAEDLFQEVLMINSTITNTGGVDGAEVAQLYITFPAASAQPELVLRGFDKVTVPVGETVPVSFSVRRRDISHWDVVAQKWAIESGEYTLSVAASSRDIRATTTLTI